MKPPGSPSFTRRAFLKSSTLLCGGAVFNLSRRAHAAPAIKIHDTTIISREPDTYYGWPTVARRRNGELLVTCSGGRESHVCPFGRVELIRSHDDGQTWTWPEVLLDGPIDDRDSGVLETAQGSILVTTFTSLAYEPYLEKQMAFDKLSSKGWTTAKMAPERLAGWKACHERLNDVQRKAELGQWMIRSSDGVTWSARYPSIVNSPHGPVQLADGRLLYAGKELWTGERRVGVCESRDDGLSWRWLADIPTRPGDDRKNYHELHMVEAPNLRLIAHIRNHNKANAGETLQSESTDGGKTWSVPHSIGVWGLPSFLLRLKDGRLLMSYGHRRPPFGNQARLSEDYGATWSNPLVISGDGPGGDLGYPSTVELADGSLLTVWYETMKGSPKAVLRQARWSLKS